MIVPGTGTSTDTKDFNVPILLVISISCGSIPATVSKAGLPCDDAIVVIGAKVRDRLILDPLRAVDLLHHLPFD